MNSLDKIKQSARMLSEMGEYKLASDLLCAYAALTDSIMPRVDLTYSSAMRKIRKEYKDQAKDFQKQFKKAFEEALDEGLENPEEAALLSVLQSFDMEL